MKQDLIHKFPKLVKEWHPTKNGNLNLKDFTFGSTKKVWWKCAKGEDHEWQTTINNRTGINSTSCPFCANKKVSVTNSLFSLFPELVNQWHPIKNGNLKPDQIVAGSHKKAWWICDKGEDHEWHIYYEWHIYL